MTLLIWSKPRKMTTVICAVVWCFFIGATISGLSPAYILIEEDAGDLRRRSKHWQRHPLPLHGLGTMIMQCLAHKYGRRIVLVGCIICVTAVTVWTALVCSRGEFFVNRILLGICASPQETPIEIIIADVFFAHDRGLYMSAYTWALFEGAFLSLVTAGYVAQDLGWQWIQHILVIIGARVTLFTFCCVLLL